MSQEMNIFRTLWVLVQTMDLRLLSLSFLSLMTIRTGFNQVGQGCSVACTSPTATQLARPPLPNIVLSPGRLTRLERAGNYLLPYVPRV